jgi:exopolysaccharide production protein ExoZ
MALSIMSYHLICWHIAPPDSDTFLGRLGIYGVSIFFILSGLSMALVYNTQITSIPTLISFYIRRIFRIWPLFAVVTTIQVAIMLFSGSNVSIYKYILNITMLFGFIKPHAYYATGAWSIGNEMVYYSVTPLMLLIYKYSKRCGDVIVLASLILSAMFAFCILDEGINLEDQWKTYVNPFNNFSFYLLGVYLYATFSSISIKWKVNACLLILASLAFVFLPAKGDLISLVTGINRMLFIVISGISVLCFWKMNVHNANILWKMFEIFGITTYGVYLLHPIVNHAVTYIYRCLDIKNKMFIIVTASLITVVVAGLSYYLFEKRLLESGKLIATKCISRGLYKKNSTN